jgi:hypothetical protein
MSIIDKIHELINDLEDEMQELKAKPSSPEIDKQIEAVENQLLVYRYGKMLEQIKASRRNSME